MLLLARRFSCMFASSFLSFEKLLYAHLSLRLKPEPLYSSSLITFLHFELSKHFLAPEAECMMPAAHVASIRHGAWEESFFHSVRAACRNVCVGGCGSKGEEEQLSFTRFYIKLGEKSRREPREGERIEKCIDSTLRLLEKRERETQTHRMQR